MRKMDSQKYPGYLTYELFMSSAFRDLKPADRDILILVYFEIKFASNKARNKKYSPMVTNRHEIKLTYAEIENRLGYSQKTIWSAFTRFLANGFLKIIKYGGGAKGDCQVYGITEDWRKWKPGDVIRTRRKNGKVGWQKR